MLSIKRFTLTIFQKTNSKVVISYENLLYVRLFLFFEAIAQINDAFYNCTTLLLLKLLVPSSDYPQLADNLKPPCEIN